MSLKRARRENDAYYTPTSAVESLIARIDTVKSWARPGAVMVEPCVGDGAIMKPFADLGVGVITNDLTPSVTAMLYGDATQRATWDRIDAAARKVNGRDKPIDAVITNPPFMAAFEILQHSRERARIFVAMFLRLSFLEPTIDKVRKKGVIQGRGEYLEAHPPDALIAVPRISFTGDGNTDSVICAWMVWYADAYKRAEDYKPIQVVAKPRNESGMESLFT